MHLFSSLQLPTRKIADSEGRRALSWNLPVAEVSLFWHVFCMISRHNPQRQAPGDGAGAERTLGMKIGGANIFSNPKMRSTSIQPCNTVTGGCTESRVSL
jgi:hypothetical protein